MNTRAFGVLRPRSPGRTAARRAVTAVVTVVLGLGLAVGLTGTLAPATAAQAGTLATTSTTASAQATYEERVQRLVNRRRAGHGLHRLRLASCADETATRWSKYLAQNNEFFHQSMSSVLDTCDAQYAGETLGRGSMTPRKLVRMWMESPAHREVLLSSQSRRIGIGATPDAYGRWVVAANFIRF